MYECMCVYVLVGVGVGVSVGMGGGGGRNVVQVKVCGCGSWVAGVVFIVSVNVTLPFSPVILYIQGTTRG